MVKKARKDAALAPKKGSRIWLDIAIVVIMTLSSSYFLTYGFVSGDEGKLNGDVYYSYSFFRDNLHSLNRFGEIEWWNPRIASGFPIYYSTILGFNCTTPLFVLFGAIAWIMGKCGHVITSYHSLYVAYFGYGIPLLFNLAMYMLARQIFRRKRLIALVVILSVFSPGTLFNLTDTIWEQTSYGVFFAASFLYFLRKRNPVSIALVILSVLVLSVSLNHLFLYWNLIFVPMFMIVCVVFGKTRVSTLWCDVRAQKGLRWVALGVVLAAICVTPALVSFTHGEKILRWHIGERTYDYETLHHGNPLQFVTISTPGVSYQWGAEPRTYRLYGYDEERAGLKYAYMGLMSLPLVVLALFFGRRRWRLRLFTMFVVLSVIGVLSGYSMIFSSILSLPTPLRAVNHYSDTLFVNGGVVILILLCAVGFDVLTRRVKGVRLIFIGLFILSSVLSVALSLFVYRAAAVKLHLWGYMLVMILLHLVVLVWMLRAKSVVRNRFAMTALLLLLFIDTSTASFWHARHEIWPEAQVLLEPDANTIGIGSRNPAARYAHFLLYLQTHREEDPASRKLSGLDLIPRSGGIKIIEQTYNRLELEVTSLSQARLFWRDCYFPFWKATIDGKPVRIDKSYNAYKEIIVPTGESKVLFWFSPGPIPFLLGLAYLIVLSAAGATLVIVIRSRKRG